MNKNRMEPLELEYNTEAYSKNDRGSYQNS